MAVRFGVQFIAQFDQTGQVLVGAKSSIQSKFSLNRLRIGGIVGLKTSQALCQLLMCGLSGLPPVQRFG